MKNLDDLLKQAESEMNDNSPLSNFRNVNTQEWFTVKRVEFNFDSDGNNHQCLAVIRETNFGVESIELKCNDEWLTQDHFIYQEINKDENMSIILEEINI